MIIASGEAGYQRVAALVERLDVALRSAAPRGIEAGRIDPRPGPAADSPAQ